MLDGLEEDPDFWNMDADGDDFNTETPETQSQANAAGSESVSPF